jgi:hypothetical protein
MGLRMLHAPVHHARNFCSALLEAKGDLEGRARLNVPTGEPNRKASLRRAGDEENARQFSPVSAREGGLYIISSIIGHSTAVHVPPAGAGGPPFLSHLRARAHARSRAA